jgi:hypothetical protein
MMQKPTTINDIMSEEVKREMISNVKTHLIQQSIERLLDLHLGTYILEEGEIVDLWEPDELEIAAKEIVEQTNIMSDHEMISNVKPPSIERLIDLHLGTYILEEVEPWEPDELEIALQNK